MAVNIEKKYQKLTDTEHVLLRPGMYVGSIKPHTEEVFLPIKGKDQFQLTEVTYNPYRYNSFVEKDTEKPISKAYKVFLRVDNKRAKLYALNPEESYAS